MRKYCLISTFFLIFSLLMMGSYLSGHKVYAQSTTDVNSTTEEKNFVGFDLKKVTLSQEQAEKIKALESDFKTEKKNINEELKLKHLDKSTLLKTYPLDAEKIMAQQKEINQLYSELQDKFVIYQIEMVKVLTEEQFKEFNLIPKKHAKKKKVKK